jgi:predicted transcriptional regulator YdeE
MIKKISLKSKTITGLKVRTTNMDEVNPNREKIAPLWEKFYRDVAPSLKKKAQLYGVYHNYESDATGEFDVLVGSDVVKQTEERVSVSIEEGTYLIFRVNGKIPEAIMQTWKEIWAYFEDDSIDERRSYGTDFEWYKSADEVEIYIGVNYF